MEIDPGLLQVGREKHTDRPYDDPRVTTHVDDGRAFLERTDRRYDLILLALPDSATIVTGQATSNCGWGDDGATLYMTADMWLCRIRVSAKGW